MAISLVGKVATTPGSVVASIDLDLTALTGGLASSPSENDVVFVSVHASSNIDRSLFLPAGYTEIDNRAPNDAYDALTIAGYKVMGATPDTVATVGAGSVDTGGSMVAFATVYRGVDTTTVQDVAVQSANSINTVLANPASITPTTDQSLILSFITGAHNNGNQDYTSSDLTEIHTANRNASKDVSAWVGYKVWSTGDGAFDAAELTWSGTDSALYSYSTITAAIRPASGGSGQTITGAAHSSADTFGAGTVTTGAVTITGAVHSSADSFGSGTISQPAGAQTITGAAHSSADTFGTGTASTTYTITGAAHSSADTIGSGTATTSYAITGAAHSGADSFGAGTITQGLTVTGTAHSSPDIFGSGSITTGAVTITGVAWASADTFGVGVLYDPDAAPIPSRYAFAANSRTGISREPSARGVYRKNSRTGVIHRRG